MKQHHRRPCAFLPALNIINNKSHVPIWELWIVWSSPGRRVEPAAQRSSSGVSESPSRGEPENHREPWRTSGDLRRTVHQFIKTCHICHLQLPCCPHRAFFGMWNGWSGSWTLMLCYSNLQRSRQESLSSTSRLCQDRLHGLRSVHMTNTDRRWPHNPTTSSLQCGEVLNTNSTAQGGGGSFKNRKPIGEIGCCESRMAERIHWWTKRWFECRIIHLSIYLSIHPSIYPSFLSTDLSACQPIHLSLSLSLASLSLSFHLSA